MENGILITGKTIENSLISTGKNIENSIVGGLTNFKDTMLNDLISTGNILKNTLCFTGGFDLTLKHFVLGTRAGWDVRSNNGDGSTSTLQYKNVWYQATIGIRFYNLKNQ